jgi:FkbM family methyltransferase
MDRLLIRRFRGMGRLRSLIRGGYPVTLARVKTVDGLTMALDPESYMDNFIIQTGYYEREVLEAIFAYLPADGVLWDVGANFGLHSLTAKHLRPNATVIAFEPVPFTAARLMMNSGSNNLDVKLFCVALGRKTGYSQISVLLRGNSGLSSLEPWSNVAYDASFDCRVERGDDLIAQKVTPAPSVIKVDVEGFEVSVLNGLSNTLKSPKLRAILFESDGKHFSEISETLIRNGFRVASLPPQNKTESGHETPNFLATRV